MTRKILFLLLILLTIYFLFTRQNEVEQVFQSVKLGDWHWFAIAIIAHLGYMLSIGASFQAIYMA